MLILTQKYQLIMFFAATKCIVTISYHINPWSRVLLGDLMDLHLAKINLLIVWEQKHLLPRSPMSATVPYPEPHESNPQHSILLRQNTF
jgi:hypothetical protein